jgi:thiol-disulfide isomerase/thioredoxin
MRWLCLAVVALIAVAGPAAAAPPQNFVLRDAPVSVPELQFTDSEGQPRTLADFRGRIVLLNLWATWCLPCRKEMPTLDRLQAALGGPDFEVVALAINRGGLKAVKKFYADFGIKHLAIHNDTSGKANFELATAGLPTTLLIDRQGQELGRLVGPAEWDASDMVAFLTSIIARKQDRSAVPQQKEQSP